MTAVDFAFLFLSLPFAAWCLGWVELFTSTPKPAPSHGEWADLHRLIAARNGVR